MREETISNIQESAVFTHLSLFGSGLGFIPGCLTTRMGIGEGPPPLPYSPKAINGDGLSSCRLEVRVDVERSG